jgi:triacylglycerol lipase
MPQPQIGDDRRPRHVLSSLGPIGNAGRLVQTIGRAAMVQASEVALMAMLAASAPRHWVGGGSASKDAVLRSANVEPGQAAHPVLLVHGFGGTKSSWSVVARALSARGLTVDTITYKPFGTSVEQVAAHVVAEVKRILCQTGADKVHLVGHSLGGVVIAEAIASGRLAGQVDTVVTLGSPFRGSPWATLLPFGEVARALREGSPQLRRLASAPTPDGVRWLAFTAALDMIVPGLRSVPSHSQVETVMVGGVGHLGMLLSQHVVGLVVAALSATG